MKLFCDLLYRLSLSAQKYGVNVPFIIESTVKTVVSIYIGLRHGHMLGSSRTPKSNDDFMPPQPMLQGGIGFLSRPSLLLSRDIDISFASQEY